MASASYSSRCSNLTSSMRTEFLVGTGNKIPSYSRRHKTLLRETPAVRYDLDI
jgi:hypothetical protein